MRAEYKVISDWFCISAGSKARKIENHLNSASAEGWEYAALESVTVCTSSARMRQKGL
ncbi:MAG: hypothetical protein JW720_01735 [Sedimentisphaerales bacterium]|nr:hypothetical protein [Sedimentisphaerales bacterium]